MHRLRGRSSRALHCLHHWQAIVGGGRGCQLRKQNKKKKEKRKHTPPAASSHTEWTVYQSLIPSLVMPICLSPPICSSAEVSRDKVGISHHFPLQTVLSIDSVTGRVDVEKRREE